MKVEAYLSFEGRAGEAIEYYRKALGAEVILQMLFKEAPPEVQVQISPESAGKVMHAALQIGDSTILLSDGQCSGKSTFQGISLSLTVKDEAEAERRYAALAEGGKTVLPLHKPFFAKSFGIVADRFGVQWMLIAPV
jgi:PhnB protein